MFLNDLWFYFILKFERGYFIVEVSSIPNFTIVVIYSSFEAFFFYYFLMIFLECVSNDNVGSFFSFKIWNKINSKVPVYAEINMCF